MLILAVFTRVWKYKEKFFLAFYPSSVSICGSLSVFLPTRERAAEFEDPFVVVEVRHSNDIISSKL